MVRSNATPRRGRRRRLATFGLIATAALLGGCSDRDAGDGGSASGRSTERSGGTSTDDPAAGDGTTAEQDQAAVERAAEKALAAAKAASNEPSGVAGQPAPNDDDGARNLASVDPTAGPQPQDASGSVGRDPIESPSPTFPEPGRPDVDGLQPLDGCAEIAAPFYRAVSALNVNSSTGTIIEGVKDLSAVAARAQAPIAAAVQTLVTTAQAAAADAARAQDFGGDAYQDAVKAVHVYLGDACGR